MHLLLSRTDNINCSLATIAPDNSDNSSRIKYYVTNSLKFELFFTTEYASAS